MSNGQHFIGASGIINCKYRHMVCTQRCN